MLDYRIHTFLALCERMNYHETAQALHMTQPAVTQHISHLEREYGAKLFLYTGRRLEKTPAGEALERYARRAAYNDAALREQLRAPARPQLRLGATKTIGEYVLPARIVALSRREDLRFSLVVDNTARLLDMLDGGQLDIALIEGFFQREKYASRLMREEPFVGICQRGHPFADRQLCLEELFPERLICREPGNGTRAILEKLLLDHSYGLPAFRDIISISSFELIKRLVREGLGISFVYRAVVKDVEGIALFSLAGQDIRREFNFVYLRDTEGAKWIPLIEGSGED